MANVNRVNGFKPVRHLNGSPYNGQANYYATASGDSAAIMVGDLVSLAGDSIGTYSTVTRGNGTGAVVGVVVGIDVVPPNFNGPSPTLDTPVYRRASTVTYIRVADANDLILEVQADEAVTADKVGQNGQYTTTAGSTTTGSSGMQLDASTLATANPTYPLKLFGFPNRLDNEVNATYNKVWVTINNHQLSAGTGTAGV